MMYFPPFRLDIDDRSLWRGEVRVPLSPKAFAVLRCLVEHRGRLLSQNELLDSVWKNLDVQPEILKKYVLEVRKALGDQSSDPAFIETQPRFGYRFIAEVHAALPAQRPRAASTGPVHIVGRDVERESLRASLAQAAAGTLRMDARAIERLLYRQSGLLGVSGISADMRTLLDSADPRAKLAVELFCYRIRRELGSLAAALGGLDAIVLTGGIGENSPAIRSRVCRDAAWLGVELDAPANASGGPRISTRESRASAWSIPTNEELMIARHTRRLLASTSKEIHDVCHS